MAFDPIDPTEIDARSPLDEKLFDKYKNRDEYLLGLVGGQSAFLAWSAQGPLRRLQVIRRPIDVLNAVNGFTPSVARASIRQSGISGVAAFDLRRIAKPMTPITGIDFQFDQATQSIAQVAPALPTQSITRSVSQLNTQGITRAKASINITSIIEVGGGRWRLNLSAAPDNDWLEGQSVLVSGATAGGNNGTFPINERNMSGHPSIVVVNPSGVAQPATAGSVDLQLFSYDQINPVATDFVAGEKALFASHTNPANDGTLVMYKTNQTGNNFWVFNPTGATQPGVAGTVDVQRFKYNLGAPASTTDFALGEKAKMTGHSLGANDGNFPITSVNSGGNNVEVYNPLGDVQGGVAGQIDTNRWIYSLTVDPSTQVSIGTKMQMENHTAPGNNGELPAVQVKRSGLNNVVVYNENGVAQAGAVGDTRTSRKLVKFATDQSSVFSIEDYFDMQDVVDGTYQPTLLRAPWEIVEVNRGGGANYNVVIEAYGSPAQVSPAGFVSTRYRTIFITKPEMPAELVGTSPAINLQADFTDFDGVPLAGGERLALFFTSMHRGNPYDFTLNVQ